MPWYTDYVNYIAKDVFSPKVPWQQKTRIMNESKNYIWEDLYVFQKCAEQLVRRYVTEEEIQDILEGCHTSPFGGYFGGKRMA